MLWLFCKKCIYTVLILSSCREEKDEKMIWTKKEENQFVGESTGNPVVQIAL
jgi:hypothetical protein